MADDDNGGGNIRSNSTPGRPTQDKIDAINRNLADSYGDTSTSNSQSSNAFANFAARNFSGKNAQGQPFVTPNDINRGANALASTFSKAVDTAYAGMFTNNRNKVAMSSALEGPYQPAVPSAPNLYQGKFNLLPEGDTWPVSSSQPAAGAGAPSQAGTPPQAGTGTPPGAGTGFGTSAAQTPSQPAPQNPSQPIPSAPAPRSKRPRTAAERDQSMRGRLQEALQQDEGGGGNLPVGLPDADPDQPAPSHPLFSKEDAPSTAEPVATSDGKRPFDYEVEGRSFDDRFEDLKEAPAENFVGDFRDLLNDIADDMDRGPWIFPNESNTSGGGSLSGDWLASDMGMPGAVRGPGKGTVFDYESDNPPSSDEDGDSAGGASVSPIVPKPSSGGSGGAAATGPANDLPVAARTPADMVRRLTKRPGKNENPGARKRRPLK